MTILFYVLIPILISVIVASVMIPQIVLISKRKKIYDAVDFRKSHVIPTSRLGGIIFFPSLLISVPVTYILGEYIGLCFGDDTLEWCISDFLAFVFGVVMIFITAIVDDFVGVSYKKKFLVQIFIALVMVLTGLTVDSLGGIFGIYDFNNFVAVLFTMVALVGLINSYNLLDGIDGLCSGMTIISMLLFVIYFGSMGMIVETSIAAAFLGASSVFFRHNISNGRYKMFMGDTGSLTVGFVICYLLLEFISLNQGAISRDGIFPDYMVVAFSVVFIPCVDTIRVFSWRIIRGFSPFNPDRTHIHHLVIDSNVTHKTATFLILLSAILNISVTLLLTDIFTSTQLFLLLLVYGSAITYALPINLGKLINNRKSFSQAKIGVINRNKR